MDREYLSVKEVSEFTGLKPKYIYEKGKTGAIPGFVKIGKLVRFRKADLLKFLGK